MDYRLGGGTVLTFRSNTTVCTIVLSSSPYLTQRGRVKRVSPVRKSKTGVSPSCPPKKGCIDSAIGLHDLYGRAKALFDLVAPQEYGFDQEAKEEIGVLTSLPLLRKVWNDLEEAKTTGKSLACFYFTYVGY